MAIEAETRAEIAEKPSVEKPLEHMIVGIDGAFVKATRSRNQRKNFEIVLGRIKARGRQEKSSPPSAISMISRVSGFALLFAAADVGPPPTSLFSLMARTP